MKVGLGLVVGALALGVGLAANAGATGTLYATPTGGATSGSCGLSAPCTFTYAITQLGSGGTLMLLPGTYPTPGAGSGCASPGPGVQYSNATIEAVPGRPRPVLNSSNCAALTLGSGAVLRDVNVIEPSSSSNTQGITILNVNDGGTADGVVDHGPFGIFVTGAGTAENSVVSNIFFTGTGGVAINDTVGGDVITMGYQQNSQAVSASATVVNTIAHQILAYSVNYDGPNPPFGVSADLNLSYYVGDYSTSAPSQGCPCGTSSGQITQTNQVGGSTTALNLASDGIHETASSPTINAGTADVAQLPTDDFDGGARQVGAPDVGADEAGSGLPIMNTLAATNVTTAGATLHGNIDTNEVDNPGVRFIYGKGSALSSQTPAHDVPPGLSTVAQQVALTGLSPNTTYSFAIQSGTLDAQVLTFHTASVNPFKGVVFEQHTTQANTHRVVALQLFCPTNTIGFCKGTLTLTSGSTKLGSNTFLTNHGNLFTVKITLTQAAYNELVQKRTMIVVGTAAAHDADAHAKTTTASITLKAPPK